MNPPQTRPKTIAFFSPTGYLGGAEIHLLNMCKHLPKDQFTPIVILPSEGPLGQQLKDHHIETLFFPKSLLQSGQIFKVLWGVWKLHRLLKNRNIDIIDCNSIFCLYVPVYYGVIFKKPIFVHWADYDTRLGDIRLIRLFKSKITVLAVSQSIYHHLIKNGIPKDSVRHLPMGIEPSKPKINFTQDEFKDQYDIPKDAVILGITGRIDTWKGHKTIIKALALLKIPNLVLVVFGDYHLALNPNLKTEIEALIAKYDLNDKIIFTGHIPNPADYLQCIDIVLAPSDYEPFGLVVIEAMSLKKPVIASNVGGFLETVVHNKTGLHAKAKSPKDFAKKIQILYNDPQKRKDFGQSGYNRYQELFHIDGHIRFLTTLYQQCQKS